MARVEHDPFCPQAQMYQDDAVDWWDGCQDDFDCRCELIAAVRADTLRRPDEHEFVSVRAMLGWAQQIREEERSSILEGASGAESTFSPDNIPGDTLRGPGCGDLPQDRIDLDVAGNVAENVAENVAASATFQHNPRCQWCHRTAQHSFEPISQTLTYACDEHVPNRAWHDLDCREQDCDGCSRTTVNLGHDPLCPSSDEGIGMCYAAFPECRCGIITAARADERRWVLASGGRQIRSHVIKDGVCACGVDAPDQLEHLAEIIEVYVPTLLPEHKTIDGQNNA